jgi:hypothetical protein
MSNSKKSYWLPKINAYTDANVNRAIKSYKTKLAMLAADCINMIDDIGKWASDNGYES